MAQEGHTTSFYVNGQRIAVYLQNELEPQIDKALGLYPGLYKSRSHFINCAIVRELRRLESEKPEIQTNE